MSKIENADKQQSAITIRPPRRIESAAQEAWNGSADVIVVGWGLAGASAALQAREDGQEVLLLERFDGGGASRMSGGIVYAGGGTPYQKAAGFDGDTVDNMFTYLKKENQGRVSDATLRRFCEDSAGNLAWLEQHGARYEASFLKHKTSYPPKSKFFYYSGNEIVPAYRTAGHPPMPRGHRTCGANLSGEALMDAMQAATQKSGTKVMMQTVVDRLVVDAQGTVVGVECYVLPPEHPLTKRHHKLSLSIPKWRTSIPVWSQKMRNEQARIEKELIGSGAAQLQLLRARKGVVLATGGFVLNPQMVAEHAPHFAPAFHIGAGGCDGSGIRMGQTVGGDTGYMNNFSGWRFITPPVTWPKGIVVNRQGARFCNEQVYGERLGHELMEHQGGKAWLILDKRLFKEARTECLTGGWWYFQWLPALITMALAKKAATPEALAAKIGADAATLRAEIDAYNAACDRPSSDELQPSDPQGKTPDMCQKLAQGPYYALDISVQSPALPMAAITLGGLRVSEDSGLVLNAQGQAIPGLYAVGRAAVGIPSGRYISGLSLADCVFSGRRAGRHVASVQAS